MDRNVRSKVFKTVLTIIFAVLSVAYWILFYLWEFRNIEIDYSFAELLGLGEFLIPIISLVAIAFQIGNLRRKKDMKHSTVILIVMGIVLLCSIADTYYTAHGVNTGGVLSVANKSEEDGSYYLVLNNEFKGKTNSIKLECDKNTFDNVIMDEKVQYCVEYIWNTLTPQTGYLVSFDLDDYCDNRNNWLENYFKGRTPNELSKAQLSIIKGSASVTSNVAEDAGVKITLDSVTGNGYYSYFKLDVELPEGMNAGNGYDFGDTGLLINDESIGLDTLITSCSTLDDGDATDNRYSILLSIALGNYPANRNYSFNNGIVRTLQIENIVTINESGKMVNLIEGKWSFGIQFTNEGKSVELIKEPVTVSGYSLWRDSTFEAEVTSFVISEFSAYCEYEITPNSSSDIIGIAPIAVMKDGRRYMLVPDGGSNFNYHYHFNVPVALDEVDYVRLTDDVILQMN